MRRIALVVLPALLPVLLAGCAYVGDPTAGFGKFAGDVFSLSGNPNRPVIDSRNARRVMGEDVTIEPLQVEPGNVWPGPLPPPRTVADIQREQGRLPPIDAPVRRGGSLEPQPLPPFPRPPAPSAGIRPAPGGTQMAAPAVGSRVLQTPAGPATTTVSSNGVETYVLPNGRTGIVMPNANGSLTLIGPDGTTQTIPAPR